MEEIMTKSDSTEDLIRRAQVGDREALAELVACCRDRLDTIVRSRMGPAVEPDDVIQEASAKALASRRR